MSVTLTTLSSDNFNRSNRYPLGGLWVIDEFGDEGLEIDSDLANGPINQPASPSIQYTGVQFYNYSLPNDSFVSVTLTSEAIQNGAATLIRVRATDVGDTQLQGGFAKGPGYSLQIDGEGSGKINWTLFQDSSSNPSQVIGSGSGVSTSAGDVFSLAAIGTTLYIVHNGSVLSSITNTAYSSGGAAMILENMAGSQGLVSLFAVGSAVAGGGDTYDPTKPFLGSVTMVGSAPAGLNNPFVGKMLVLSSAPSSPPGPYLGHVVQGSAPASGPDNLLGQVVVVASAPAGAPDPFLGTVDKE